MGTCGGSGNPHHLNPTVIRPNGHTREKAAGSDFDSELGSLGCKPVIVGAHRLIKFFAKETYLPEWAHEVAGTDCKQSQRRR